MDYIKQARLVWLMLLCVGLVVVSVAFVPTNTIASVLFGAGALFSLVAALWE